jgi:hypothetical protein
MPRSGGRSYGAPPPFSQSPSPDSCSRRGCGCCGSYCSSSASPRFRKRFGATADASWPGRSRLGVRDDSRPTADRWGLLGPLRVPRGLPQSPPESRDLEGVAGTPPPYPAIPATAGSERPALVGNPRRSPLIPEAARPACHAGGHGFESRRSRSFVRSGSATGGAAADFCSRSLESDREADLDWPGSSARREVRRARTHGRRLLQRLSHLRDDEPAGAGNDCRGCGRLRCRPPRSASAAQTVVGARRCLASRGHQSGYSSFRQARGSSGGPFGVRSSRKL